MIRIPVYRREKNIILNMWGTADGCINKCNMVMYLNNGINKKIFEPHCLGELLKCYTKYKMSCTNY